jgi:hypothetical protein
MSATTQQQQSFNSSLQLHWHAVQTPLGALIASPQSCSTAGLHMGEQDKSPVKPAGLLPVLASPSEDRLLQQLYVTAAY